jgi:hypothetical protein
MQLHEDSLVSNSLQTSTGNKPLENILFYFKT